MPDDTLKWSRPEDETVDLRGAQWRIVKCEELGTVGDREQVRYTVAPT